MESIGRHPLLTGDARFFLPVQNLAGETRVLWILVRERITIWLDFSCWT